MYAYIQIIHCFAYIFKPHILNKTVSKNYLYSHEIQFYVCIIFIKATSNTAVVFLAELTTSVSGTSDFIHFDQVKINEGNAYHHGTFVAPVSGTYQFSVTCCSNRANWVALDLSVNTATVGRLLAGDNDYDECTSKVYYVHLTANDDVYVKHEKGGGSLLSLDDYGLPSFGGFLIHKD